MARTLTDPIKNFRFHVRFIPLSDGQRQAPSNRTINQGLRAGFMSASGFSTQTDAISYREGGDNTTTRKLPGQSDFPPITLQRGTFDNMNNSRLGSAMFEWFSEIFFHHAGEFQGPGGGDSNNFRCNLQIDVLDHPVTNGDPTIRLRLAVKRAWPTSFNISDLDAGGNAIMVEQISLVHEGITPIYADSPAGLVL